MSAIHLAPSAASLAPRAVFATTRWSVVLSARDQGTPDGEKSLETLCQAYWYPLYAYVRRRGYGPHDAQDLTQEFFACLLRKNYLDAVDREKGRFRTFLLVAFQRFLANEHDRLTAQKRGGGQVHLSLDATVAEHLYQAEPLSDHSPDRTYDRRWALALLDRTLARLRQEAADAGKVQEFEKLKIFLTLTPGTPSYAELARQLGGTDAAARVAVHRLRKRFRDIFHEEIAGTVDSPEGVSEEIRHLLAALTD